MSISTRKYIVTSSNEVKIPETDRYTSVQMIYRISDSGLLQRIPTYMSTQKSIMGIYDNGGLKLSDIEKLGRDIVNEINRRNYAGVILDYNIKFTDLDKCEKICSYLSQRKILYFLPVEFAQFSNDAKIIIPASVSGGSINEMIELYVKKYSNTRICLEIVRGCNEFEMPAYKPEGMHLDKEQLNKIFMTYEPQSFFSSELGCKYFTYRTNQHTHFVLYDDAETAIYKTRLAEAFNLFGVFFLESEWKDSINIILKK